MKRRAIGLTNREMLFMAVPVLCVASLNISTKPLWALLHFAGLDNGCSFARALDAEAGILRQNRISEQIQGASTMEVDKAAGLVKWTTPSGMFWAPPGTAVGFLLSEQKIRIYGDGPRRVQPGDVVLDCGANIGTFTREALDAGAAKVVAIEPSERNVECLRRNFAKEIAEGKVVVYPKGVWHREEVLEFNVFENSALDSLVMSERIEESNAPRKVRVPVTTVDRLVAALGLEKVDFIKMDVEGAERNAIRGAAATIRKMRPR
ncbi:MAG: FkbM family methyltransferase, partial [Bryobacteraceae bacterium]